MKKRSSLFLLTLILAFLPLSINAYAHPGKLDSKGGHTCRTNCSQYGLVDTPETVHPSKPVQPFGKEASHYIKGLLPVGKAVNVEFDVSQRDKYGRLLAYLHVDGKMANELLLQKGLARVAYIYAPNTRYVDEFRAIQRKAQEQGIGIWSLENYVQEDGFQS